MVLLDIYIYIMIRKNNWALLEKRPIGGRISTSRSRSCLLSIEVAGRRGRKGGWTEEIFHGEREEFSPDLYRFLAAKYLPFIRGVAAFIAATASHRDYILYLFRDAMIIIQKRG